MKRLYDTTQWRKLAKRHLAEHPMCAMCAKMGRDTPANTVDHIKEHHGNPALFWDVNNLQSLCPSCHSGTKRIAEHHGYSQACDIDGFPLDNEHPWHKDDHAENK